MRPNLIPRRPSVDFSGGGGGDNTKTSSTNNNNNNNTELPDGGSRRPSAIERKLNRAGGGDRKAAVPSQNKPSGPRRRSRLSFRGGSMDSVMSGDAEEGTGSSGGGGSGTNSRRSSVRMTNNVPTVTIVPPPLPPARMDDPFLLVKERGAEAAKNKFQLRKDGKLLSTGVISDGRGIDGVEPETSEDNGNTAALQDELAYLRGMQISGQAVHLFRIILHNRVDYPMEVWDNQMLLSQGRLYGKAPQDGVSGLAPLPVASSGIKIPAGGGGGGRLGATRPSNAESGGGSHSNHNNSSSNNNNPSEVRSQRRVTIASPKSVHHSISNHHNNNNNNNNGEDGFVSPTTGLPSSCISRTPSFQTANANGGSSQNHHSMTTTNTTSNNNSSNSNTSHYTFSHARPSSSARASGRTGSSREGARPGSRSAIADLEGVDQVEGFPADMPATAVLALLRRQLPPHLVVKENIELEELDDTDMYARMEEYIRYKLQKNSERIGVFLRRRRDRFFHEYTAVAVPSESCASPHGRRAGGALRRAESSSMAESSSATGGSFSPFAASPSLSESGSMSFSPLASPRNNNNNNNNDNNNSNDNKSNNSHHRNAVNASKHSESGGGMHSSNNNNNSRSGMPSLPSPSPSPLEKKSGPLHPGEPSGDGGVSSSLPSGAATARAGAGKTPAGSGNHNNNNNNRSRSTGSVRPTAEVDNGKGFDARGRRRHRTEREKDLAWLNDVPPLRDLLPANACAPTPAPGRGWTDLLDSMSATGGRASLPLPLPLLNTGLGGMTGDYSRLSFGDGGNGNSDISPLLGSGGGGPSSSRFRPALNNNNNNNTTSAQRSIDAPFGAGAASRQAKANSISTASSTGFVTMDMLVPPITDELPSYQDWLRITQLGHHHPKEVHEVIEKYLHRVQSYALKSYLEEVAAAEAAAAAEKEANSPFMQMTMLMNRR